MTRYVQHIALLVVYTCSLSTVEVNCVLPTFFRLHHYMTTMRAVDSREIVRESLEDSREIKDPAFVDHGLSMLCFRLHHPYGFSMYMKDFAEVIGRIKIDIFRQCSVIRLDKLESTMYPDISAYFSKTRENKTGKAVWEYDCPYAYVGSGNYLYFTLTIHFPNNTDYVIRNRAFLVLKNQTAFLGKHDDFRKNRLYRIGIKNWPTL